MSTQVADEPSGYSSRATSGVLWMTVQKWFSRVLGLLTVVILTRLLTPADFGLVAVAMSVVPFLYLLSDLGFSAYLVQAEKPRPQDYSTAFWYSLSAGTVLALGLGLLGTPLGWLLKDAGVAHIMWGLAPTVLLVSAGSVPAAIMRRELRFQTIALQTIAAGTVGQVVAVVTAFAGFGVWALVLQTSVTQLVVTALNWRSAGWRPSRAFSMPEFRRMLRYGVSIVAVEVSALGRVWAENAIVATTLGLNGLGYLSIAQRLVQVAQDLTATAITPVSTVVFAQIRVSSERVASAYSRAQSLVYAIVTPVMVFLAVAAALLVPLLFGGQWATSVPPAQGLAIAGILTVGASLDNGLYYGLGRPGRWLAYAVGVDALTVGTTWVMAPHGLDLVALGFVGVALAATAVRWPLVGRQIQTAWWRLGAQFLRAACLAGVTGLAGLLVLPRTAGQPDLVRLAVTGLVVVLVWSAAVRLLLPAASREIWRLVRSTAGRLRRPPRAAAQVSRGEG